MVLYMPESLVSDADHLYEEVIDLFAPESVSEQAARERAEIRAHIDDYNRRGDEIREAMNEAELKQEAAIDAERAACRMRAEANRAAFEADVSARRADREVAVAFERIDRPREALSRNTD